MKRHAFPKRYRLLKRREYLAVQNTRVRIVAKGVVVIFRENDMDHPRFGITVSKKVGKAVVRNRIKRLIREAIRLNMPSMRDLPMDIVIIAKKTATKHTFSDMMEDLAYISRRLRQTAGGSTK